MAARPAIGTRRISESLEVRSLDGAQRSGERGVKMPSFFGYMAWACALLLPVFVILTFVSLR
jgi:Putative citrate transport